MAAWTALWQRVPEASPFQTPHWLLPWWDCFGNAAPVVVTAWDEARLTAVLPLYRFEDGGCRKLLPIGIGLSDYIDALVDPDYSDAANTVPALLAALPDWDECYVPDIPPGGQLLAAQWPSALAYERHHGETCPVLVLPDGAQDLRGLVPPKTLRDLRQGRRRAAAAGAVAISRVEASTLAAFMHEFFRLHEFRWQRIAGHGVCADPIVRRFHLAAAERMLDAGLLRLYLMHIENSTVAAYYGFFAKKRAYAYLGGFDPDRAGLSPGSQILAYAIEEAMREGAREFHFLRGGEAYKYAWGAVDRRNTTLALRRHC